MRREGCPGLRRARLFDEFYYKLEMQEQTGGCNLEHSANCKIQSGGMPAWEGDEVAANGTDDKHWREVPRSGVRIMTAP